MKIKQLRDYPGHDFHAHQVETMQGGPGVLVRVNDGELFMLPIALTPLYPMDILRELSPSRVLLLIRGSAFLFRDENGTVHVEQLPVWPITHALQTPLQVLLGSDERLLLIDDKSYVFADLAQEGFKNLSVCDGTVSGFRWYYGRWEAFLWNPYKALDSEHF